MPGAVEDERLQEEAHRLVGRRLRETVGLIASYVRLPRWRVKRHLKPTVFNRLSPEILRLAGFGIVGAEIPLVYEQHAGPSLLEYRPGDFRVLFRHAFHRVEQQDGDIGAADRPQ